MSPLRLALVTRRFWPLVGGAEIAMANLAEEFTRQGHQVQLVTAQWHPNWPRQISHRGIPVTRLPNPSLRGWGTWRYMMSLGKWLRQHEKQIDAVYVSMLKHSASAAVTRLANSPIPVILRAEGAGDTGDCAFHQQANFGHRLRATCQKADGFVAPSQQIHEELLAANFPASHIRFIPNGVNIPPQVSPEGRIQARQALGAANAILRTRDSSPLVVYTGRLHPGKGLAKLIRIWPTVLEQFPTARLWLVGEGPQEGELAALIEALGLKSRIALPGVFDTVEDILAAADAFVLPSHFEGMSISLLEAMAAGLPCVVSDIPGNRVVVSPGETGLTFDLEHPLQMADAICKILGNQPLATQLGAAARRHVQQHYGLTRTVEEHVRFFRSLIEAKKIAAS